LLGLNKTEPGVMDLEVILARPNLDRLATINIIALQQTLLNYDSRRLRVDGNARRVDNRDPGLSGKPEFAVIHFVTGRLAPTVALDVKQAVLLTISNRVDLRGLSLGVIVQLLPADPVDAPVRAHPKKIFFI